jgi:uncharacterized protein YjdB
MRIASKYAIVLSSTFTIGAIATNASAGVCYSVRVQGDTAFRSEVCDGIVAGTTGQAKRLEQIKIRGTEANGKMCYKVHVEGTGWSAKYCQNQTAGVVGKRIEAIEIVDTAIPAEQSVYYQVHVQNYGWMPLRWDGGLGGTTGKSLRMEAIAIAVQSRPQCPDANWKNFSGGDAIAKGDGLIALAANAYPGGTIACSTNVNDSQFYDASTQTATYIGNQVIYTGNGGWYYLYDVYGNVWNIDLDHYNNIVVAGWDKPDGSSINLGTAKRNWATSGYGVGTSME